MWAAIVAIFQAIGGAIQLWALFQKNKFEKDKAEQERKNALKQESKDAVKEALTNRDTAPIVAVFDKLRNG